MTVTKSLFRELVEAVTASSGHLTFTLGILQPLPAQIMKAPHCDCSLFVKPEGITGPNPVLRMEKASYPISMSVIGRRNFVLIVKG